MRTGQRAGRNLCPRDAAAERGHTREQNDKFPHLYQPLRGGLQNCARWTFITGSAGVPPNATYFFKTERLGGPSPLYSEHSAEGAT
jgi:hypothetical protein